MNLIFILFIIKIKSEMFTFETIKHYFNLKKTYKICNCTDQLIQTTNNALSLKLIKNTISYPFVKKCKYSKDPIESLHKVLNLIVIGQKKGIKMILNHLSAHIERKKDVLRGTPLVLHFAGDFGVGKTLTASVISTYLFPEHIGKDPVDHKCSLLLSGSNYLPLEIKNENEIDMKKEKIRMLRKNLINQLKKCPNSLIIINDLQKMDSDILSGIEDFFEGVVYTDSKKQISSKKAIFIFTSDFGSADVTRGWGYFKLEKEIKNRFSLYTNYNKKLGSLVVHIPFKSLNKKDIKKIIINELLNNLSCDENFDCVEFNEEVIKFLLSKWESSKVISNMNGRAFNKYIYPVYIENEVRKTINLKKLKDKDRNIVLNVEKVNGKNDTIRAKLEYNKKKINKYEL